MLLANLALRFIVELVGVGALAYAAYQAPLDGFARVAVTVVAPLAFIVFWAVVVAPKAATGFSQRQRDAIGTGLLVLVAVALGLAGQPAAAAVFGAVVLVNWALGVVLGQDASSAIGSVGDRSR